MPSFDLYKKRTFGDYISDTITFVRTFGKHYFGNYFKVNGVFLLILAAVVYLLSEMFLSALFANLRNGENAKAWDAYFNDSYFLIFGGLVGIVLVAVLLSLISVTYTVLYMDLVNKRGGNDFGSRELVVGLKQQAGRIFLFFILSLVTLMPLGLMMLGLLMIHDLIALPVMFVLAPSFLAWIGVSYYTYITERQGYFAALKSGIEVLRQQFGHILGATIIVYFMTQLLQTAVTLIPYIIGIVVFFVSLDEGGPNEGNLGVVSVGIALIFVISVVAGYFFNNLMVINQGLIYYSGQENLHNNSAQMEIDNIGSGIE